MAPNQDSSSDNEQALPIVQGLFQSHSKLQLEIHAQTVIDKAAKTGNDLIELTALLAKIEVWAKAGKEYARKEIIDLIDRGEPVQQHGVELSYRGAQRGKVDYSADPIWSRLLFEMKQREKFLDKLPREGRKDFDEATGEEFIAMPPTRGKGNDETITISIK